MRFEEMRRNDSGNSTAFFSVASSAGIDCKLVEDLKAALAKSGARSIRACLHDSAQAPLHNMVVVVDRKSYARPHKHAKKPEAYHLIDGEALLVLFDEAGNAIATERLGLSGQFLFRVAANTYHALIPLSDILVYHEVREGPFETATESVFPRWAPDGRDHEVALRYLGALLTDVYPGGVVRKGVTTESVIHRRETCRLCGAKNHVSILKLTDTPLADAYISKADASRSQPSYPLELFLCTTCGQSQLLDVIDPSVLYRDYIYVTTDSLGLGEHFKKYAEHVTTRLGLPKDSLVVDVGSNDGTLLRHFKHLGMRVLGVEPATEIAAQATARGTKTLPEFFSGELAERTRASEGNARLITMNNLFANIDDLEEVARGVSRLLAPNGVFVFETFYFVDYIENMVFDFMYHEHLSYNTIKPLSAFFNRFGLELFDVDRVPTKGGSVRCYVQPLGGPHAKTPILEKLIAHEEKLGIHKADGGLFTDFKAKIASQKARLRSELSALKALGRPIAGYGASATSTTLIYHFGLMDQLDFLIDDNEDRQTRLSPGCHLPILPSKALLERKPAAVVLLAWRYRDPIFLKNRAYLAEGGKFLIPLPEFEVVTK